MIKCHPMLFIAATKWVLSDTGGRVWNESKNDVFIIDPQEMISVDHLVYVLKWARSHGWTEDDILTSPQKPDEGLRSKEGLFNACQISFLTSIFAGSKKIYVIGSFRDVQGFEAETVINFDSVVKFVFTSTSNTHSLRDLHIFRMKMPS